VLVLFLLADAKIAKANPCFPNTKHTRERSEKTREKRGSIKAKAASENTRERL
jgi:hypothetical protein